MLIRFFLLFTFLHVAAVYSSDGLDEEGFKTPPKPGNQVSKPDPLEKGNEEQKKPEYGGEPYLLKRGGPTLGGIRNSQDSK